MMRAVWRLALAAALALPACAVEEPVVQDSGVMDTGSGGCQPTCREGFRCAGTVCVPLDAGVEDVVGGDGGTDTGNMVQPTDGGTSTVTGRWTVVASRTTQDLYGPWGASTNDLYAVGPMVIEHWNGSAWTPTVAPTQGGAGGPMTLKWVSGSGSTVLAVGIDVPEDGSGATGNPWVERLSGTTATGTRLPGTNQPSGIWMRSPDDGWIVTNAPMETNAHALRLVGGTWTDTSAGIDPTSTLYRVWGQAENDVFALGTRIYHWTGTGRWTEIERPLGTLNYYGAFGFGANDVWLVGTSVAMHWDGAGWRTARVGTGETLYAAWGVAPNDLWAVGANGTIVHWNGIEWTQVGMGVTAHTLRGILGFGRNDIWAVGEYGTILHYQ